MHFWINFILSLKSTVKEQLLKTKEYTPEFLTSTAIVFVFVFYSIYLCVFLLSETVWLYSLVGINLCSSIYKFIMINIKKDMLEEKGIEEAEFKEYK